MEFKSNIPKIEKILGYTFRDKSLLTQSFTRTSYANEKNGKRGTEYSSNEVLEFFGDSVLSTAIISILMEQKTERYSRGIRTSMTEGDFSNLRSKLSDKKNLSKSTEALGLQKFLLLGEGDKKLGIDSEPSVMEDLFESIVGAVYIDCGMDIGTVIEVVRRILDVSVYLSATQAIQSHKNALQEYCADKSRRLPAPVYKTVSENGPDHRKIYERACYIGDKIYGIGKGKNTKLADSSAAEAALKKLHSEKSAEPQAPAVPTEATSRLKEYAQRHKLPSPEFRDLGESENSTDVDKEYVIECRLSGFSARGVGRSKQDARARASQEVLDSLTSREKKKPKESSHDGAAAIKRLSEARQKHLSEGTPSISLKDSTAKRTEPSKRRHGVKERQKKEPAAPGLKRAGKPKGTQKKRHKVQQ